MAIGAEPVKANPLAIRRDGHVADAVRRITCQTGNCPALEVQRAQAVERCLGVAHTHAESLLETRLFVRIDAIRSGEVDALCVRRKASETNTGLMPRAAPAGQFPPCRTGGRAVEGARLESVRCGRESRHALTAMCLHRRHARYTCLRSRRYSERSRRDQTSGNLQPARHNLTTAGFTASRLKPPRAAGCLPAAGLRKTAQTYAVYVTGLNALLLLQLKRSG